MSGTSQWAMSEPIMAWSSAPNGLTAVLKASEVSGSSASQPKKKRSTKSALMSSACSMPHGGPLVQGVLGLDRPPGSGHRQPSASGA